MANSRFYQFLYSKVPMLTYIQCQINVGASGAVSSATGNGVYAVTKLAVGIYQIQLVENYNAYIGGFCQAVSGVTGAAITAGSFVSGTLYSIVSLGTTVWASAGLNSGLTAAVGQTFVATGVGAGTGTVKAIAQSLSDIVEIPYNPQVMLQTSTPGLGAIITINTYSVASVNFTGDTATSTAVTNVSSPNGLVVGQALSGAGIVEGTTISALPTATTMTLSIASTATTATVPMTAVPGKVLASPNSGSSLLVNLLLRNSSNTY